MSLTKQDLLAIKVIVEEVVEDAKRQTAAGFEEVHRRIDAMQRSLDETNIAIRRETLRNDDQDVSITTMRQALHSA